MAFLNLLLLIAFIVYLFGKDGISNSKQSAYRRRYDAAHNYNLPRQSQVEIDIIVHPEKYEEKLGHPIDRTKPVYYKKAAAEVLAREGINYDSGSRYQDPEYMRKAHGVKK